MDEPHSVMLVAMVYWTGVGCCKHCMYSCIITIYH